MASLKWNHLNYFGKLKKGEKQTKGSILAKHNRIQFRDMLNGKKQF